MLVIVLLKVGKWATARLDTCDCGMVIGVDVAMIIMVILVVVCAYVGYQFGKDSK